VQERVLVQIGDGLDWPESGVQLRACDGKNPVVEHTISAQVGPFAAPVANRGVKVRLHEIDQLAAGAEAQVDLRMPLIEIAEARQQPLLQERTEQTDVEQPCRSVLLELLDGASELGEPSLHSGQQAGALRGEPH